MDSVADEVLSRSGFSELNPVQKKSLDAGLLEGKSMVVSAPTASGKTLVAEMAALRTVAEGKKVVYIVPLKALASEKHREFREKYDSLGCRTALSIGDMDASDPWLAKYDIIIVTSEKFDSLLRHGISWLGQVGLVVVDEIHLLNDPGRGPTLEVMITKLKSMLSPQIIGLSATISNYEEISGWLGAKPVRSDYRPVKLFRGVCFENEITYHPRKRKLGLGSEVSETAGIIKDTLGMGKQALVFVSTRRNAEALAGRLGGVVQSSLGPEERNALVEASGGILHALERPTLQCEKLSGMVKKGVSFHHAGITSRQRKIIEDSFREGKIKVIAATPTLAWGLNLPAFRVVVRDTKRFSSGYGMDYIPVLEVQQMAGRAGRPKYDETGEAILVAKNRGDAEYLWDNYVHGEPEKIQSKLGVEPVLRMHTLALVASGMVTSMEGLVDFFSGSFYARQYGELSGIERQLDKIAEMLKSFGFIKGGVPSEDNPFRPASEIHEGGGKLEPTPLGKRVSELYIDPLTANYLVRNLEKSGGSGLSPFSVLQLISNTIEMRPGPSVRKRDMEGINELMTTYEKDLLEKPPNPWEYEYDDYLRSMKMSWVFSEWMDELGEDLILEKFGVTPGETRSRLNNADWLLYATQELSLLMGMKEAVKNIRRVRVRMKYGVREELLPLVRLKGIGRVRARKLYSNNLRKLSDVRKVPLETLSRMVGPKTASNIKEQLDQAGKKKQGTI